MNNLINAMGQPREQGQDAERLPNDAYAAQGGKAAVNELLTMKMNQCLRLNDKLNDIRDLLPREGDFTGSKWTDQNSYDNGFWDGRSDLAESILQVLNRLDD